MRLIERAHWNHMITITDASLAQVDQIASFWQLIDNEVDERPFGGNHPIQSFERAKDMLNHAISAAKGVVLVATSNSSLVGTISGHVYQRPSAINPDIGVIYSLWVDPSYRRQGVGESLLKNLEEKLHRLGATSYQVGWDNQNALAANWWEKRGYAAYEVIASKNHPSVEK